MGNVEPLFTENNVARSPGRKPALSFMRATPELTAMPGPHHTPNTEHFITALFKLGDHHSGSRAFPPCEGLLWSVCEWMPCAYTME